MNVSHDPNVPDETFACPGHLMLHKAIAPTKPVRSERFLLARLERRLHNLPTNTDFAARTPTTPPGVPHDSRRDDPGLCRAEDFKQGTLPSLEQHNNPITNEQNPPTTQQGIEGMAVLDSMPNVGAESRRSAGIFATVAGDEKEHGERGMESEDNSSEEQVHLDGLERLIGELFGSVRDARELPARADDTISSPAVVVRNALAGTLSVSIVNTYLADPSRYADLEIPSSCQADVLPTRPVNQHLRPAQLEPRATQLQAWMARQDKTPVRSVFAARRQFSEQSMINRPSHQSPTSDGGAGEWCSSFDESV
ncbi:unnamed protein product [Diplocarpon coronariae]|nr:hypothetical protein JHW43_003501 [Diplocarpon mali]